MEHTYFEVHVNVPGIAREYDIPHLLCVNTSRQKEAVTTVRGLFQHVTFSAWAYKKDKRKEARA